VKDMLHLYIYKKKKKKKKKKKRHVAFVTYYIYFLVKYTQSFSIMIPLYQQVDNKEYSVHIITKFFFFHTFTQFIINSFII
jgi:hypothetical protein